MFDLTRARGYLLYAAGEVVLIVLGIFIAIQLDAAQQRSFERGLEKSYVENLIADLRLDVVRSDAWFSRFDRKVAGLLAAKDYYFGGEAPVDPQAFISQVGIGGAGSRGRMLIDAATFEELISTGNLRYIRDDAIKAGIIDFYTYKDFIDQYNDNLRTAYASYTNGSWPYAPRGEISADPRDITVALERFRRPDFLAMINEELTYAYSMNTVMERHVEDAKVLAETLEDYLRTF
jgi:hypothetical protein